MALISWVILNVTSIILPFELSPAFFKVGFALPAHSIFQVLIDIWSSGCNPQLYFSLPVLFVYEVLGIVLSSIGVYRRAHYACIKQEMDEKASEERVTAILREQQEAQLVRRETMHDVEGSETSDSEDESRRMQRRGTGTTADEADLANIISREMSRPKVDRPETGRDSTGPSFALAYKY